MFKINLQRFAEAVSGKRIIYLYRTKENASSEAAQHLAYTTENGRTKSKDADSTATKDGSIRTPGATEVEITATAYVKQGDTLVDELEAAMDNDKLIEIWEANLDNPASTAGKYSGAYYQGYLTEIELSSDSEEFAEYSLTFGVNGSGVKGDVTVSDDIIAKADNGYEFTDTVATAGA